MVVMGAGFVYVDLILQHSSILWLNSDAGVGVAICESLSVFAGSHCGAWLAVAANITACDWQIKFIVYHYLYNSIY